jgi:hypothetical protein
VTLEESSPDQTVVILMMEYEPEGFVEKTGDARGIASTRVERDLQRFRDLIEGKGRQYVESIRIVTESAHSLFRRA